MQLENDVPWWLEADLVTDEERDAELDDDRVDEHGFDEEEISACTPTWRA